MNILISEELKRYKGIKISDTGSLQNSNLQEFLDCKNCIFATLTKQMISISSFDIDIIRIVQIRSSKEWW
jgi:hypothetical protein